MLKDILSIGGKPGLYKMISQAKNGLVVESLIDKKRIPAFASAKISALEDIAIFTEDEDLALKNVLKLISDKENGGACLNHKSSNEKLKKYFEEIIPEYDRERVYVSDIKKVLNWYNILLNLQLLNFEEEELEKDESAENAEEEKTEKKKVVKKPVKAKAVLAKKPVNVKHKATTASIKVQQTRTTKNK